MSIGLHLIYRILTLLTALQGARLERKTPLSPRSTPNISSQRLALQHVTITTAPSRRWVAVVGRGTAVGVQPARDGVRMVPNGGQWAGQGWMDNRQILRLHLLTEFHLAFRTCRRIS